MGAMVAHPPPPVVESVMATAAPQQWYERPLTHRDLDDLPEDDGVRYEVIDGELYMAPFPFISHQQVATALGAILWAYLKEHPIGRVFTSNTKVVLGEPTGVGPDVVYVSRANMGTVRKDGIYGPPDLMVEVTSSKPNLDRVVKYRKYASSGVRNYWIIDPDARTVDVFELRAKRYKRVAAVKDDETFATALFPGLVIPLAELWG
jgi:Uma2 family endonuclease